MNDLPVSPENGKNEAPPAVYSTDERRALEEYIQSALGPIERVYFDAAPELAQVDVVLCSMGRDCALSALCTVGVGARRMAVGQEEAEHNKAFAELMILLPPGWDLSCDSWPIDLLKATARHAYQSGTAIEIASAYHGALPPESGFYAVLATPGATQNEAPTCVLLPSGKMVNLITLLPILEEEWRYMQARGSSFALFRRLTDHDALVFTPGRESCVDEDNWFDEDIAPFVWTQDSCGAVVSLTDMNFCAGQFARIGAKPDGSLWAQAARAFYTRMDHPSQETAPVFVGSGGVFWVNSADDAALRRFILRFCDLCQAEQLDTWIRKGLENTL